GTLTVLAWYGQAMLGAPVLMNFGNAANFVGPSAGFLLGFVAMVFLAGLATDRGIRGPVRLSLVALALSALIYLPGLAWPLGVAQAAGIEAGWAGLSLDAVVQGFAAPFLLGDAVKAILAALIVTGGFAWMRKRRG
ncbi:MAG: biotin transporter BioY, partial [Jannaschia sp.]